MKAQDLPIYRATYQLLEKVANYSKHFHRSYKLSLAPRLQTECTEMVMDVYRANAARQGRRLPRRVPPGPSNPLGSHFIALGDAIGIHGTNAPTSIGRAVSRGCIRMHPDDILIVAASLRPGDAVWIVASVNDSMAPLADRAARQDGSAQSTSSRHFLPTLPAEAGA